jgi:hypothetical protein
MHLFRCAAVVAMLIPLRNIAEAQGAGRTPTPTDSTALRESSEVTRLITMMIKSDQPRRAAELMADEVACLTDWYGSERAELLLNLARTRALRTQEDLVAYRRASAKLAGAVVEPTCRRRRP